MKTVVGLLLTSLMISASAAVAQRSGLLQQMAPRANQGHIPAPPVARSSPDVGTEGERLEDGRINDTPHVNHDQWYGHDLPGDPKYRLVHPFEHGRFEHFGPSNRYKLLVDRGRHRFWLPGGFYFEVAAWDWPIFLDWCWDCGDDFVVYEDPDHIGWYLLYNIHTGAYVHVQYLGL